MSLSNPQAQSLSLQPLKSIMFTLVTTFVHLYLFCLLYIEPRTPSSFPLGKSFLLFSFFSNQGLRLLPFSSTETVLRGKEWSSVVTTQTLEPHCLGLNPSSTTAKIFSSRQVYQTKVFLKLDNLRSVS